MIEIHTNEFTYTLNLINDIKTNHNRIDQNHFYTLMKNYVGMPEMNGAYNHTVHQQKLGIY